MKVIHILQCIMTIVPLAVGSMTAMAVSGCGMAYLTDEIIPRNNTFQGFTGRLVDAESGDGVANAKSIVKHKQLEEY